MYMENENEDEWDNLKKKLFCAYKTCNAFT